MTSKSNRYSAARRSVHTPDSRGTLLSPETFRAFLLTLAIGAGCTLLFSLAACFYPDPGRIVLPLGYFSAALTSFLGGVVAKRCTGGAPALCGLINGMLLMGVMILFSFFFLSESHGYSALVSSLLHAAVLILSVLGALAGTPKQKNTMRSRRRYH